MVHVGVDVGGICLLWSQNKGSRFEGSRENRLCSGMVNSWARVGALEEQDVVLSC